MIVVNMLLKIIYKTLKAFGWLKKSGPDKEAISADLASSALPFDEEEIIELPKTCAKKVKKLKYIILNIWQLPIVNRFFLVAIHSLTAIFILSQFSTVPMLCLS